MNNKEIKKIEQFEKLENLIKNIYGLNKDLKNKILNNFYINYSKGLNYNKLKKLIKEDIKQTKEDNKIYKFMRKNKLNDFSDAKYKYILNKYNKNNILYNEFEKINNDFINFKLKDINEFNIEPPKLYNKIKDKINIIFDEFIFLLNKLLINNFNKINERISIKITNEEDEIKHYCLNDDFKQRLSDILLSYNMLIDNLPNFSD